MDDKKLERIKAKERSFVMKLTKKDIVELLKKCGYTLNEKIYSENDGKLLPAIERFYNTEKGEYQILIRCNYNDKLTDKIYEGISCIIPQLNMASYNPNMSVILLTDYYISEMNLNPNAESKQQVFAKYMYQKFGEYYRIKYNQVVRKEIKETKEEQSK